MNNYYWSLLCDSFSNCYICGAMRSDVHHIFEGTANRRLSDKYGLKIPICRSCCDYITRHPNSKADLKLKAEGQKAFEGIYKSLNFKEIFGKNYL